MPSKTNSDFKPSVGEFNSRLFGDTVEILGYRTVKQQIELFMPQGSSLGDEFYDSNEDFPEDDPSLGIRDLELAEIGHLMVESNEKLTASAKQARMIQEQIDNKVQSAENEPPKSEV